MTTGRTKDGRVGICTATQVHLPTTVLGLSANASASVTTEDFLGRGVEEASVHSIGRDLSFSTVYDTSAIDRMVAALLDDHYSSAAADGLWMVLWSEVAPAAFQALPIDLAHPSYQAPAADAISRPWSMSQRDAGYWGTTVVPFGPTVDGTELELLDSHPADAQAIFLLTDVDSTVTRLAWGRNGTSIDPGDDARFWVAGLSTSGTVTITSTGGTVTGVLLVGQAEEVPHG
ncbi:MAG: hypothetical protein OXQ93_13960 [Gemmatimonadota bacterium]|nr:hypothetical protein [Gemmatimonadota bacterium]